MCAKLFRKSLPLITYVAKYKKKKKAIKDSEIRNMRFASWMNKATDTQSAYSV
jgi:hypothetical protein